jgi:hypothetical protein
MEKKIVTLTLGCRLAEHGRAARGHAWAGEQGLGVQAADRASSASGSELLPPQVAAILTSVLVEADPAAVCYSCVFSFEDSLADTSNYPYHFVYVNNTCEPTLRLPYGETFFNRATDCFSNRRIVLDFVSNTL